MHNAERADEGERRSRRFGCVGGPAHQGRPRRSMGGFKHVECGAVLCYRRSARASGVGTFCKGSGEIKRSPGSADEAREAGHDIREISVHLYVRCHRGGRAAAGGRLAQRPRFLCRSVRGTGRNHRLVHSLGGEKTRGQYGDCASASNRDQSQPSTAGKSRPDECCATRLFTLALVTSATDVTMIALPARM